MKKIINVLYIWKILGPTLSVHRPFFEPCFFFRLNQQTLVGQERLTTL